MKFNQLKTTESLVSINAVKFFLLRDVFNLQAKFPRLTDFYVEGNPLAQEPK